MKERIEKYSGTDYYTGCNIRGVVLVDQLDVNLNKLVAFCQSNDFNYKVLKETQKAIV